MPIELINVERVDRVPTRKLDCIQYHVIGRRVDPPQMLERYQTLNLWIASLCERAKATDVPLHVTWRDHRFGRELVYVELAQ